MASDVGTIAESLGRAGASGRARRSRAALNRVLFSIGAGFADAAVIIASVLAVGWAYHLLAFGETAPTDSLLTIGAALALFVLVPNALRGEYQIAGYLDLRGHARRSIQVWNLAFVAVIVLGFLTKTSPGFSRGTVVLVYFGGFLALVATRYALVRLTQVGAKTGTVSARRIFLVGFEEEVMAFASRHQPWNLGMEIAGVTILPREGLAAAAEPLAEGLRQARVSSPDDVFVLISWDRKDLIDAVLAQFMTIPASIHLGAEPILDRFHDLRIARVGTVSSVQLVRRPMAVGEVALKRVFDGLAAACGLLLLTPLFIVVAIAIKLDSHGPVFFMQRRYGFNQQPFRIWKFRTMLVMEDGAVVRQASANDPRITRVGRFLRRWNIDELPQLVNVLTGDMSLVGPRPHALAHDREYETRIALYARRHNVKPGITGWAQVNGFRGETDTDDKMRARVEHDLHYIDNWSLTLDVIILARTLVSPKAYRNAG